MRNLKLFLFEISQVALAGKSTQRAETVMNVEEIRGGSWQDCTARGPGSAFKTMNVFH